MNIERSAPHRPRSVILVLTACDCVNGAILEFRFVDTTVYKYRITADSGSGRVHKLIQSSRVAIRAGSSGSSVKVAVDTER